MSPLWNRRRSPPGVARAPGIAPVASVRAIPTIPTMPGSRVTRQMPMAVSGIGQPYHLGESVPQQPPTNPGTPPKETPVTMGEVTESFFWTALAPFLTNFGLLALSWKWIDNEMRGKQYKRTLRHGREVPTAQLQSEDRLKVFLFTSAVLTGMNHYVWRIVAKASQDKQLPFPTGRVVLGLSLGTAILFAGYRMAKGAAAGVRKYRGKHREVEGAASPAGEPGSPGVETRRERKERERSERQSAEAANVANVASQNINLATAPTAARAPGINPPE